MKKNIIVCCQTMLTFLGRDLAWIDGIFTVSLPKANGGVFDIAFCPWCGKKLPFPCAEDE